MVFGGVTENPNAEWAIGLYQFGLALLSRERGSAIQDCEEGSKVDPICQPPSIFLPPKVTSGHKVATRIPAIVLAFQIESRKIWGRAKGCLFAEKRLRQL